MFYYKVYNLKIKSYCKIVALEKQSTPFIDENVDVIIRKLNKKLSNIIFNCQYVTYVTNKYSPMLCYETDKYIILRFKNQFWIAINKLGNEIIIDENYFDLKMAHNLAIGSALSLCFYFKGIIPLHASSIEINNSPVVFVANSGTGKSTLMHSFVNKGYKCITDDVLPIIIDEEILRCISSKNLKVKLCKENILLGDYEMSDDNIVTKLENKYWISLNDSRRSVKDYVLSKIFILSPQIDLNLDTVIIEKLEGMGAFESIISNLHFIYALPLNTRRSIILKYFELLYSIDVYKIKYFKSFGIIDKIISNIIGIMANVKNS